MFARIVEFIPSVEKKEELIRLVRTERVPNPAEAAMLFWRVLAFPPLFVAAKTVAADNRQ